MRQMDVLYHVATYTVATAIADLIAALTPASGVPLEEGYGAAAVLRAVAGNITAGNMRCLVYMPHDITRADNQLPTLSFEWMKYTALDFAPTTGAPSAPSGDKWALTGVGRIIWLPDAVTVSSGTTARVVTLARRRLIAMQ